MDMPLILMGRYDEGVPAVCETHSELVGDPVRVFRRDLAGLEALPNLVEQHVALPRLLPAGDGMILLFCKDKFQRRRARVALVGGNQQAVPRLGRVFAVFDTARDRRKDAPPRVNMPGYKARSRQAFSSLPKAKARQAKPPRRPRNQK